MSGVGDEVEVNTEEKAQKKKTSATMYISLPSSCHPLLLT
jgi:hypothetical protein